MTPFKMVAKRVDIVSLKMVKEKSYLYAERKIRSCDDAAKIFRDFLQDADREQFLVIYLSTKNEPTCLQTISMGTLNASLVHPREVFKTAILSNASSILLGHNHPSGDPSPSPEDLEITNRLVEAGSLLGIKVMDHIILGDGEKFVSLKERNLING